MSGGAVTIALTARLFLDLGCFALWDLDFDEDDFDEDDFDEDDFGEDEDEVGLMLGDSVGDWVGLAVRTYSSTVAVDAVYTLLPTVTGVASEAMLPATTSTSARFTDDLKMKTSTALGEITVSVEDAMSARANGGENIARTSLTKLVLKTCSVVCLLRLTVVMLNVNVRLDVVPTTVGDVVGDWIGLVVGDVVGLVVGYTVGLVVGDTVGLVVGDAVHSQGPSHKFGGVHCTVSEKAEDPITGRPGSPMMTHAKLVQP